MPWSIKSEHSACPTSRPFGVVKDDDGELEGCHGTKQEAQDQLAALNANENRSASSRVHERAVVPDLSVRSDGRTVYGIAMPYDTEAIVNDGFGPYTEIFRRGAFAKTLREIGERVKLCVNHDKLRRLPIGRATSLREDAAGLYGEFRVSRTTEGDEALTLIRDGVVDAFSVGFIPMKEREPDRGVIERTEVKLSEVSVVSFPAYEKALIAGVRSAFPVSDEELEHLIDLMRTHPDLLTLVAQEAGRAVTSLPPPSPDTPTEGAVTPEPTEAGSEPADEATRTDEPDGESTRATDDGDKPPVTYQPAQRAPMSPERRQAQMGMVRALLAQTIKE